MGRVSRLLLRVLAWGAMLSAGTGILLSVPPVSILIYPVYRQVHILHGWLSIAVALPFTGAVIVHGIGAWTARGLVPAARWGIALSLAFPLALITGLHNALQPQPAPGLLVLHFAGGIAALLAAYVHGRGLGAPLAGGETRSTRGAGPEAERAEAAKSSGGPASYLGEPHLGRREGRP